MTDMLMTYEDAQKEFDRFEFLMPDWDVSIRPMVTLPGDRDYMLRGFVVVITVDTFDTYTYREPDPGPRTPVQVDTYGWGTVTVTAARFAREDLNPRIQIQHLQSMYLPMPKSAFPDAIRRCIHAALQHEADEWIRVDGEMVYNPHEAGLRR